MLGGLLSGHLLASDGSLELYDDAEPYDGELLVLAEDLGRRLLPAFDTPTGIPYGTVNLAHGVPEGETAIASLAGAGSLSLEFSVLSALTGDAAFGRAAKNAVKALYERRSALGLLGKHVNIRSGKWVESLSGVGSNSDSFYEYLLKMCVRRMGYIFSDETRRRRGRERGYSVVDAGRGRRADRVRGDDERTRACSRGSRQLGYGLHRGRGR